MSDSYGEAARACKEGADLLPGQAETHRVSLTIHKAQGE